MTIAVSVIAAYLIGSIPFSFIFSRLRRGVDPRHHGTKNVGATNTLIIAGKLAALLAVLGDIAKGIAAIMIARYLGLNDWGMALTALTVIVGHDFPLFLGFKGGKGVATTAGVLFGLDWIFGGLITLLWVLCMLLVRYFIPGSVLAFLLVPLVMWLGSWRSPFIIFALANAVLAIFVHRKDLERFFSGKEATIQEAVAKYLKKS